ncbi:MAG TPA: 2-amino-4-hydroxy-6-hydroxymethyldihydropteridine diphosphokinase [Candidatus Acidoferrales bacterium]|nr:2-amino-4-hydroxy-6-hydroxymethyldihydropteridine diphosphokinase [Candidatus Acidoferrales bacterium]
MKKTVYLGLGSNLGDRAANLAQAIAGLAASRVQMLRRSSLYATEPVGAGPQHWFLNCVVEASTDLMPRQLLRATQQVERNLGRRRGLRNAPRTVDIDILFYAAVVVSLPDLEIPHPRIAERRFVLVPLREIAPGLRHPTLRRTIAELLAETRDRSEVRRWHPSAGTESAEGKGGAASTGCDARGESA